MATTTDLQAKFEEIKNLVLSGQAMDAFEKYYGENVVMQENENPATEGKSANRDRELDFFSKVTEFRAAEVKAVAFGEDVIISEWFVDYTHAEWGKVTHDQVSVQRWQDGKVIHERFYYAS
ncbi:SnoaL-like polyketide cyclase [Synechococcus sp. PCC 7502]|uniref:SnoaL-like domain-containing protein n=1 Tax=Synechococcus sp. PCC 7502 TaxID=1173263 RepID=UPI00029FD064|nr:SnoaL-like domain-containing protein [Synechococcus sp. PCC 7502]AFY73235.1 SnoaL-like polyketide cyclase [Synechococcus sp. PCC 7502]